LFKKFLFVCTMAVVLIFSATITQAASVGKTFYYFDTVITFTFRGIDTVPDEHWNKIEDEIKHIQYTFSRTDATSELYKLNQSAGIEPFKASDDLYTLVKLAVQYAEDTNGKFEPTIGPLLELWGEIGNYVPIPTAEEISAVKELVNYQLIEFDDNEQTIYLPKPGMIVDLGAISKGYAADKIAKIIRDLGYEHVIINLGGNMLTIGPRDATNNYNTNDWVIGLKNPKYNYDLEAESIYARVLVTNKTIVSSGTYERFWYDIETGKQYHHILNPETGFPVDNSIEMVSIITESSTAADALSTSVLSLGIEEGMRVIESLPGVEAIFVTYDKKVYPSSGIGEETKLYLYDDTFEYGEDIEYNEPQEPTPEPNDDADKSNVTRNIVIAGLVVTLISVTGLVIKKKIN
jgi:FAD:protein FMN transferase